MLSEEDIQDWFDDKSPTDLVSALYHMLDSSNWADELCIPEQPVATRATGMLMHRLPPVCIGHADAATDASVGALLVGLPPMCDDMAVPAQPIGLECHTSNAKQMHRIAKRRDFVLHELATRPPSGSRISEMRSERASKRPRGARGRYLPQEQKLVLA